MCIRCGGYPNQKFLLTFTIALLRCVAGVRVVDDDRGYCQLEQDEAGLMLAGGQERSLAKCGQ